MATINRRQVPGARFDADQCGVRQTSAWAVSAGSLRALPCGRRRGAAFRALLLQRAHRTDAGGARTAGGRRPGRDRGPSGRPPALHPRTLIAGTRFSGETGAMTSRKNKPWLLLVLALAVSAPAAAAMGADYVVVASTDPA